MKSIAIIYQSRYGQTATIARFMAKHVIENGGGAELVDLDSGGDKGLDPTVEGAIFGGPVYAGRFSAKLIEWVKDNKERLSTKRTAFFSVSLNAADKRESARVDDDRLLAEFIKATGFCPRFIASIAGAVKYLDYFWLVRRLLRSISKKAGGPVDVSRNHEFTDWQEVRRFVDDFRNDKTESTYFTSIRFTSGPINLTLTATPSPEPAAFATISKSVCPVEAMAPLGNVKNT